MATPTAVRGEGLHIEFFREAKVPIVPSAPPAPGANQILVYCRIKAGNPVFYFQDSAGVEKELGPGDMLNLSDTPSAYAFDDGLKILRVKESVDGVEFATHDGTGDPHEQYAFDYELFHDKQRHDAAAIPGTHDEALGPHYLEVDEIATPVAPAALKRRIYVENVSGNSKLVAKTKNGDIIALERPPPILTFPFPRKKCANEVFLPRPAFINTLNIDGPNVFGRQNFSVTAGVAGGAGDTNEVVLESTTTDPFSGSPSWTLRAEAVLGVDRRVQVTLGLTAWVYNPVTDYLRVRGLTIDPAQPPEDVMAYFEWDYYR